MNRYLNRIDRITRGAELDDSKSQWLVKRLSGDVVEVVRLGGTNAQPIKKYLTYKQYEAFKQQYDGDQLVLVEWAE